MFEKTSTNNKSIIILLFSSFRIKKYIFTFTIHQDIFKKKSQSENKKLGTMKEVDEQSAYVSHFQNVNAHSKLLRYGIPIYIVGVLSLLLASDIGSGISAALYFSAGGKVLRVEQLLSLSIFTSVRELWKIGSYPVAILIAVLSIAWPYCKLILTMFVWFMPWESKNSRRRELIIEILDACSKWSLVDVLVLFILMVGLRYTADLSTGKYQIYFTS